MVIKLNEDKSLQLTSTINIFTGESNSELIQILILPSSLITDLNSCEVILYYLNENDKGNAKYLLLANDLYKGYYVYETLLDSHMTSKSGRLKVWIEIKNTENNFHYKSMATFITISESLKIDSIISEMELSLLDQQELRIQNIHKEIKKIFVKIIEEKNKITEIAQLILSVYNKSEDDT